MIDCMLFFGRVCGRVRSMKKEAINVAAVREMLSLDDNGIPDLNRYENALADDVCGELLSGACRTDRWFPCVV